MSMDAWMNNFKELVMRVLNLLMRKCQACNAMLNAENAWEEENII